MKTLNELLEEWAVMEPGLWDNQIADLIGDWWAVSNDSGIVAYFGNEKDALAFRLMKINMILNSQT